MGLDQQIASLSKIVTLSSISLLLAISALSLIIKHPKAQVKKLLYLTIVVITVSTTLFLAGSTIFLNSISSSRGPVHHHADFEIWACGQEHEIEQSKGLSNKVGTEAVHIHNDKRIHIEGVIVKPEDASLGNFFESIGGKLTQESISFPGHEGLETFKTGDSCESVKNAQVQVFVYKVKGQYYEQSKITSPQNYIISAANNVPPGDCIIIELDRQKARTDKLCQSFKVAQETGKLKGELKY
ncbi:hypothetical protein HYU92_03735 [Candidatus Curtissbacteria bacterium]|nr:hypothetical protein [Candidatus Curtissbacteria bacterium]